MVRRLVIPIDSIPAIAGSVPMPGNRPVTDVADRARSPQRSPATTARPRRVTDSDAFAAAVVHSKVRSPADPAGHPRTATPPELA